MPETQHVEVKQSKIAGAGRGLFAAKDLAPGDIVLSVDRPLVAEPEFERRLDTCAWCLHRSELDPAQRLQSASMGLPVGFIEVKACTGCRRAVYCSKACQSKAWKREHKYECKIIGHKDRPDLPQGVRIAMKLIGRLKAEPEDERLRAILQFRPAGQPGGLDAARQQDSDRFSEYQMLAHGAYKYMGEPKIGDANPEGVAQSLYFNIMTNVFELQSPIDDGKLGIGFDPFICTANHSCDPNAILIFNQPRAVLRALKPIKKGEEIFMHYTDVTNPFSVRHASLRERYYFNCQCPKCKKGAKFSEDALAKPPEELSPEYCKLADTLITRHEDKLGKFFLPVNDETTQRRLAAMQAEAFSVADRPDGNVDEKEIIATIKMCIGSGMWSWTRQPVPDLCRKLFGVYIASGSVYKAFRIGLKRHFEITPSLYPQTFYPDRLIDLWALSAVSNVLCGPTHLPIYEEFAKSGVDLPKAYFGFLLELRDNLPKMYGADSPFGRVVEQTYTQLMEKMGRQEADIREIVKEVQPSLAIIARKVDIDSL